MTIREIVYRLLGDFNQASGDANLTTRHAWSAFWGSMRVLLKREHDLNRLFNSNLYKTQVLNTETVDKYADSCVPLECAVCRIKLPKVLFSAKGPVFRLVGNDFNQRFTVVNAFDFENKTKLKGNSTKYAYVEGDYLYLSECVPCLKVGFIPEELDFSDPKGCSILDTALDFPPHLFEPALSMAKQGIGVKFQIPTDTTNNNNPNPG